MTQAAHSSRIGDASEGRKVSVLYPEVTCPRGRQHFAGPALPSRCFLTFCFTLSAVCSSSPPSNDLTCGHQQRRKERRGGERRGGEGWRGRGREGKEERRRRKGKEGREDREREGKEKGKKLLERDLRHFTVHPKDSLSSTGLCGVVVVLFSFVLFVF